LYDSVQFYQLVRFRTTHKNTLPFKSPPHLSASPNRTHPPSISALSIARRLASPAPPPAMAPLGPRPFDHSPHSLPLRRRHCRRLPRTADSSYSVHHSMPASPNAKIGTWPATAASTAEFPIPHPPPEPSRLTASSDNLLIINGLRESHLSTKTPSHPKYY